MSDSVRPQRRQPTRQPRPWDSTGKNTGVGCHFLLQCMKVKSEREVAQSCPTPSDPMDCSLPGSSVHGIFQAKVLQWGAIASCRQTWACWLYVSGFVDLPLCFWLECYRVLFKQGPGNVEAGYSSFTSKKESIPRTLMLYN